MIKLADKTVKSIKAGKEVMTTEKVLTMDVELRQDNLTTKDIVVDEGTPTPVQTSSEVESSSTISTTTPSTTSESTTEKIVTTQQVSTNPPTTTTTISKN